uniref:Uncharacterized protein n=1 Tax=Arundo donax TaxID=35708 RepID=A0A0A9EC87_ARUDO
MSSNARTACRAMPAATYLLASTANVRSIRVTNLRRSIRVVSVRAHRRRRRRRRRGAGI